MNIDNTKIASDRIARARGIRLIDVIAVVGLVALGVVIFSPVYTGEHNNPRTSCLSNLKQLTQATLMYTGDNDDGLPLAFTFGGADSVDKFITATFPYCKNKLTYLCDGDKVSDQDQKPATIYPEGVADKMSYVHCLSLKGLIPEFNIGKRMLTTSALPDLSKVPYLRDPIRGFGTSNKKGGESSDSVFLSPHGAHFAVSYLDGHVHGKNPIDEKAEL